MCLRRELRRQVTVLRMQFVYQRVPLPVLVLAIVQLPPRARKLVLEPLQIALQPIGFELQREAGSRVRLA